MICFNARTTLSVSYEIIYRTLFIQLGALRKELLAYLRHTCAMHRSRHYIQNTDNRGRILDTVSIGERPVTAEDRVVRSH
jgi:IS30 family transposase